MARRKSKLNRKKKALDVDITSLLDILVILLVFLLKSYNASDLKLEPAAKIELPSSASQALGRHSVIIQVNADKDIWIDNQKIGKLDAGGDKIDVLFDRLMKIKEAEKEQLRTIASETERKRKESKQVNLVLDQSLPYKVVRRVMHTSAMAGYPEFKFIVQGNF
jgi:biopolymer transport protein ExbD